MRTKDTQIGCHSFITHPLFPSLVHFIILLRSAASARLLPFHRIVSFCAFSHSSIMPRFCSPFPLSCILSLALYANTISYSPLFFSPLIHVSFLFHLLLFYSCSCCIHPFFPAHIYHSHLFSSCIHFFFHPSFPPPNHFSLFSPFYFLFHPSLPSFPFSILSFLSCTSPVHVTYSFPLHLSLHSFLPWRSFIPSLVPSFNRFLFGNFTKDKDERR